MRKIKVAYDLDLEPLAPIFEIRGDLTDQQLYHMAAERCEQLGLTANEVMCCVGLVTEHTVNQSETIEFRRVLREFLKKKRDNEFMSLIKAIKESRKTAVSQ